MKNRATSTIVIRPARPQDSAAIARLANALNHDQGKPDSPFTEALVLREGFGSDPAFSVLLAERANEAVGYALFHPFFNSDLAARGLWLVDLFVVPEARGVGAGRALLAAIAAEAVARGMACVWWGVYAKNEKARQFYETLGASDEDARILELDGEALHRLAGRQVPPGSPGARKPARVAADLRRMSWRESESSCRANASP